MSVCSVLFVGCVTLLTNNAQCECLLHIGIFVSFVPVLNEVSGHKHTGWVDLFYRSVKHVTEVSEREREIQIF